jgi:hypothetical protein
MFNGFVWNPDTNNFANKKNPKLTKLRPEKKKTSKQTNKHIKQTIATISLPLHKVQKNEPKKQHIKQSITTISL